MHDLVGVITQSWFWRYLFSHFGWVDWTLSGFLFIGLILGLKNGVTKELPRLIEVSVSLYVTLEYYTFFAEWLARETPWPESYARVLTFALLGLLSWFILRLLFEIVGKLIHLEVANPFQAVGGLLLGGARYFLFFAFLSYFLLLFSSDWIHRSYQVQSWSGQTLVQIPLKIHDWIHSFYKRVL